MLDDKNGKHQVRTNSLNAPTTKKRLPRNLQVETKPQRFSPFKIIWLFRLFKSFFNFCFDSKVQQPITDDIYKKVMKLVISPF